MRRSVIALDIVGLLCAVALPSATADVLLKDDFSSGPFKGVVGVYIQGIGSSTYQDPPVLPYTVEDGVLKGGNSDSAELRYLLLTGDKSWADLSITSKIRINGQNTGVVALVLRAAPKANPEDPDTWYEFRYATGYSRVMTAEEDAGITQPETNPSLRILKVVNGKWTILAENTASQEATIPMLAPGGDYDASGAIFRFTAKGDLLQGFISLDGTKFDKVLEAKDGELKAGLVGLDSYDYDPWFDDLLVESL